MIERIDHAAEARNRIVGGIGPSFDQGRDEIAVAQVHATLALVEQQRVANVLFLAHLEAEGGGTDRFTFNSVFEPVGEGFGVHLHVRPDIAATLGIGGSDDQS